MIEKGIDFAVNVASQIFTPAGAQMSRNSRAFRLARDTSQHDTRCVYGSVRECAFAAVVPACSYSAIAALSHAAPSPTVLVENMDTLQGVARSFGVTESAKVTAAKSEEPRRVPRSCRCCRDRTSAVLKANRFRRAVLESLFLCICTFKLRQFTGKHGGFAPTRVLLQLAIPYRPRQEKAGKDDERLSATMSCPSPTSLLSVACS